MPEASFASELLRRRVPQFLGVYIAATWMAIEIGDWMTERFALPDSLTAYIFIGMLALVPTVGVIAWGHGAPGRDQWTRFQAGFMGANVLLAILAMVMVVQPRAIPPAPAVAATETVTLVDEAGNAETYEVARSGFHQSLLAFFFTNDTGNESLDWISYAAPWAVAEDLNRNPLVSVNVPLGAQSVIERLRETGYPDGVGEPLSLNLQIARSRGLHRIITGSVSTDAGGAFRLIANLIDVDSGQPLAQWTETGADWLDIADRLSGQIRNHLLADVQTDTIVTELTIKEHLSADIEAVQLLVEGMRLRAFDNDYAGAIAQAEAAVERDPTFALAHVMLSTLYRLAGDVTKSLENARKALALDYKLYSEIRFAMKANEQAIMGNLPQAIRMLERWAQIHPQSAQVHEILAENYLLVDRIDDAREAYERLLELAPDQQKTLLSLARTYRMQGEFERAIELMERYIDAHKQDASALIQLGKTHIQLGNFNDAREAFDEAAFVDSDSTSAQIAQAKLLMREGRMDEADAALKALEAQPLDDRKAFEVSIVRHLYFTNAGQIRNSLAELARQKELVQSFLPPIIQVFQVDNQVAMQMGVLGNKEAALEKSAAIRATVQAPFDSLTLLADLEIFSEFEDLENYERVLKEVEQFMQRYQFPFLEPVVQLYKGEFLSLQGEFDTALEMIEEVIEKLSRSPVALQEPLVVEQSRIKKAEVLRRAGRLDEGIALINQVLDANPGMSIARLELVELLAARGDSRLALNEARALDKMMAQADSDYSVRKRLDALIAQLNSA